jgi:hypothetical protein
VMRLSPAVRLVIRIGSGLLVAAAIAVALTVPAPAFDELCMIMTAPSATSGDTKAVQALRNAVGQISPLLLRVGEDVATPTPHSAGRADF